MSKDRFIFKGDEESDPEPDAAARRQAEENLARFLSDPENVARRPSVKPRTAPEAAPTEAEAPPPFLAVPPELVSAPSRVEPLNPIPSPPPKPSPDPLPNPPSETAATSGASDGENDPAQRFPWLGFLARTASFAFLCAMIWLPTLYYITRAKPVFETSWRIILPGEGVKSSIDVDSVGEAKTSEKSIFASRNFDPRSTYREIAGSSIVVSRAHDMAALTGIEEFASPKIKVIPQTAILQFSLRRNDPETAQIHARIFMDSFDERVGELRLTELRSRKGAALDNVQSLRAQLQEKQRIKLALQREAGLFSEAEYKSIVESAGKRRNTLTEAEVELRNLVEKFRAFTHTLGIAPDVASQALVLKSDRLFQSLATAYVEATTKLAEIDGNFGKNYPDRVMTAARKDEYEARLVERIRVLTGAEPNNLSLMIDLTQSAERSELFAALVRMKADVAGQLAKVRELRAVVARTDAKTLDLADDADRVAAAIQEAEIANAIFASSLANADLSQTNPYASYPLYQVLDEPKLPGKPVAPKKLEAIAGATGATLLIITGFAALWYRRRVLRRRRKNA